MIGMKFWSPPHRGTTCWCRCAAIPAPAIAPWFIPRLNPCAPLTSRTVRIAVFVKAATSLHPAPYGVEDPGDGVVDGHTVLLLAAAVAEGHRPLLQVAVAGDHHERDLLELRVADLLLHPVIGVVDLDPDPLATHPGRD